jgi:glycerophosphoryl diester phosphodiesterase
VRLLREEGAVERSLLLCFDWRALAHARAIAPEIPRVHSLGRGWGRAPGIIEQIAAQGGAFWFPHCSDVDAPSVARARAAGLGVATWTANEPAELRRLLELGVDSICTDYPDRLLELLRAR